MIRAQRRLGHRADNIAVPQLDRIGQGAIPAARLGGFSRHYFSGLAEAADVREGFARGQSIFPSLV